jgi:RHS repeat-associated protein
MQMPNRNSQGNYRYAYQGQEKDPETGKEAFQLRLYDSRINRWLTTDPAGQYHSPYMAMGNNPVSRIDPDGGVDGDPSDGAVVYNQDVPGLESITLQQIDGRIQEVNMLNEVTVRAITPISLTFLNENMWRSTMSTGQERVDFSLSFDKKLKYKQDVPRNYGDDYTDCSEWCYNVLNNTDPNLATRISADGQLNTGTFNTYIGNNGGFRKSNPL